MKKLIFIITVLSVRQFFGQTNLVPNPSFEQHYSCPGNISEFYKVIKWKNFCGSPDYMHACGSLPTSVPYNFGGFQYAASGNGYADVCTWENTQANVREYIGAKLDTNLMIGKKYYFSFKANAYFKSSGGPAFSNKIGLKFTTVLHADTNNISNNSLMNNQAHVFSTAIITDTLNWTKVSGSFIADSIYQYVVIGNFFNDANTSVDTTFQGGGWPYFGAYYGIEDVCVSRDSTFNANFSLGLIDKEINIPQITVFPNPTSDRLTIECSTTITDLIIRDKLGQTTLTKEKLTDNRLDVSILADGLYFLEIISDGKSYYNKLIIRH